MHLHFPWLPIRWAINCRSQSKVAWSSVSSLAHAEESVMRLSNGFEGHCSQHTDIFSGIKCFDGPITLFDVDYSKIGDKD